ncbi:MAG TPA: DUF11 domain-containing protein, partial [Saprospiraceae bacterium]|nr:DUF11 domain-containing protein [Saprospiraceae bacterium]
MKRFNSYCFLASLFFLFLSTSVSAQKFNPNEIAQKYIEANYKNWGLTTADISELRISDQYKTKHNGLIHIYYQQQYNGIDIYNALLAVHVRPEGTAFNVGHRLIAGIAKKINATSPQQQAVEALQSAAKYLGIAQDAPLKLLKQNLDNQYLIEKGNISKTDIPVKLCFFPTKNNQLKLAWDIEINDKRNVNYWSIKVDATTGEVLDKNNYTLNCKFESQAFRHTEQPCTDIELPKTNINNNNFSPADNASYNVFPVPLESPLQGNRALLTNPADPDASPFGWHDTDGLPGAEHTTTRGNNVITNWNRQASTATSGDEPDGGASLVFDFPFDQNAEPLTNGKAAVTNLFYMNNFMHDFSYQYGFDEAAGNFQQKNYTGEGQDEDPVIAVSQYGANIPSTPNDNNPNNDYINNANFTALPEGSSGIMRMYAWDRNVTGAKYLSIDAPVTIAGLYETATASFGQILNDTPVTGEIVEVDNGSNHLACTVPNNTDELNGKIALIDRGECDFSKKVFNAQQAGAIGVIICNFEDILIGGMAAGDNASQVTIPSVFIKANDCTSIRGFLTSQMVTASLVQSSASGPDSLDGSFANSIISHEYAHGISIRLTGGPGTSSCLRDFDTNGDGIPDDGEQMGEGWSDFFALVTSVQPGDTKTTSRGIGSFVTRQQKRSSGLRSFPYNTDLSIDPANYENMILRGIPYGTGEVWTATLWDLYWELVDVYGWDADLYHGTGGNNIAIQLVIDAMKIQPCNPTMVDGRDAILAADEINNDGANSCLIWRVFARRGIGFGANANDITLRSDNIPSFEQLPACIQTIKIAKTVTPLINAGDDIEVQLIVSNDKAATATGVTLTDEIPDGASFMAGSSNMAATESGGVISFDIGTLATGQSATITYKLKTSSSNKSIRHFFDGMENGDDNWFAVPIEGNTNIWTISDTLAYNGSFAYRVNAIGMSSKQDLQLSDPIAVTGTQPVLRFFHKYDTEPAADGGFVELSKDGGVTWENAEAYIFRNGYSGLLRYTTFAIPNAKGFWGKSDEFVGSYIDLSSFAGEDILVQFRFATDASVSGIGWFIDDFELMDLYNYQSQACVSSNEGDMVCAYAPEKGTLVESNTSVPTQNLTASNFDLSIFPNPAKDILNVNIMLKEVEDLEMELFSLDGKRILSQKIEMAAKNKNISLDVANVLAGFYFLK